jgi:SulP family sulfate permease
VVAIVYVGAPLAAYIPRAALAGLLIVTGVRLVDRKRMVRIWRISKGDTTILAATFVATLLLPLEFAVLTGVLVSFARHLIETSQPVVESLVFDESRDTLVHDTEKPECPQLGVMTIRGSLYFAATAHVETEIQRHLEAHPDQKLLLLQMEQVNRCDFTGLRLLETLVDRIRQRGGDLFLTGVRQAVWDKMQLSGFDQLLGLDHFLPTDRAIEELYYRIIDPVICIYRCPHRVWTQCQTLPKSDRWPDVRVEVLPPVDTRVPEIEPEALWERLQTEPAEQQPIVVDVREQAEFERGHVPQAKLMPMPELIVGQPDLAKTRDTVFVCRSGRRSARVVAAFQRRGQQRIRVLKGGMTAWRQAGLPQVIE